MFHWLPQHFIRALTHALAFHYVMNSIVCRTAAHIIPQQHEMATHGVGYTVVDKQRIMLIISKHTTQFSCISLNI